MQHKHLPAHDPRITPEQGVSRDGQPLSYNRAPAADLAPWIARLYVAKTDAPEGHCLSCGLLNDTAFIRIQLAGHWVAETAAGRVTHDRSALFFGPQSRRMPISVTGGFVSLGISLRPGACTVLKGPRIGDYLDRIVSVDEIVPAHAAALTTTQLLERFDPAAPSEDWLGELERLVRLRVERAGRPLPDPVAVRFETISFADPTMSVIEAAREIGIDRRRLERIVSRDFGLPPKQVLCRARALDMASHLRGVADADEAAALALRYYDDSHLIREFTGLFGMSPRQFAATPQPLMTSALESRQARRLEALHRIEPGQSRPWE
ncbi:helix-turn-helix domain-containing protein [Novosphingobium album (ex Liu et al. 2023)]|uniref:Helix-turn-helix domain-containing protein n=1 Tax=Novosphingobium album (ex Liu et al. 2023) TaxID=3031130 RepID=A0ABT5WLC5_9SPHN|nr:helix-turn-helix domain-containing protein [Novosphingobium album (ex Liu et al. 2023)]MDE8650839.1 helix-turn-helix domain-containing protein [Novosphingobium album (ex Liu et al. 2023)]